MDIWKSLLMGALQGLTEFLPVSSSGHLVILKSLMGVKDPGALWEVAAHLGTFFAILVVFRKEVIALASGATRSGWAKVTRRREMESEETEYQWRLALAIIVGSIPAGIAGLCLIDRIEALFACPAAASGMIIVTGVILVLSAIVPRKGRETVRIWDALLIGLAQAVALVPGISRSGSTIAVAIIIGIRRAEAAKFSFLLVLPALAGAGLLEFCGSEHVSAQILPLLALIFSSFIVGAAALIFLLRIVRRGRLYLFAFYCIPFGIIFLCYFGRGS